MLSKADNELLTATGGAAPMGQLFRRFWLPALLSQELPENDGPPVRLRLLSEELVAFGIRPGTSLTDGVCPHRGANLFYGRNEAGGIRCIFHGWKFDVTGACLEMPNVPQDATYERLRAQMNIVAYPTHEFGDVIWAYMGPGEPPPFPHMEFGLVPSERRFVSKKLQQCNWAQAMEGALDTAHFSFLHTSVGDDDPLAVMSQSEAAASGDASRVRWLREDGIPHFSTIDHDAGIALGAARKADPGRLYWRISQFLLPNHALVPSTFPGENYHGQIFMPIDDESCWIYCFTYNPERDLGGAERERYRNGHTIHANVDAEYIPLRRRENEYLMDRWKQKHVSFTGIDGVSEQDAAAQDSQGRIADRTREHLTITDVGIIQFRKLIMNAARALERGEVPIAVTRPEAYCIRGGGWVAPETVAMEDVMIERFGNPIGRVEGDARRMTARGSDFKASLRKGETHFGLFLCLPTAPTAEALAGSGFGFFIIDVEHGPTTVPHVHAQLTALAAGPAVTVARLGSLDIVTVKQYLDIGTDVLMIPNIESAAMARDAVRFMRYPPDGVRGIGGSMRVTDYGRNMGYLQAANESACIFAQIETKAGMEHLDEICAVPEVDVVFFGPNDYAGQMGLLGQPGHPDVIAAMDAGIKRAHELGKATGILIGEPLVDHFLELGVQIIAVGSEIGLMARSADALAQRCNAKRPALV